MSSKVKAGMQALVKVIQAGIFLAVVGYGLSDPDTPKNGLALGMAGIMVVAIFTVAPWLIYKAVQQGIQDIRRWRSKPVSRQAVVSKLLDDGVPFRRIGADRSPRIGK